MITMRGSHLFHLSTLASSIVCGALVLGFASVDWEENSITESADLRPQQVVLGFSSDPTNSISVAWRGTHANKSAYGEITEASGDPDSLQRTVRFPAETESVNIENSPPVDFHRVLFTNLLPGTRYAYRVGSEGRLSEWFHFTTAKATAEPFSFIYLGDAQNEILSTWSRTVREAILDEPDASFILSAGDMVDHPENYREWEEWFVGLGWVSGMIPTVAAAGNHEYDRVRNVANRIRGVREFRLTPLWRPQFAFPENGPEGLEETVYYFDYQGARFIALNSNEQFEEQASWLENILRENPHRWTIVTFHHPFHSTRSGRDNVAIRDAWGPLFDRYGVDLVLNGHDHNYGRSGKIHQNRLVEDDQPGTVHVVSVSGPKLTEITTDHSDLYRMLTEDAQLFQIIRIEGDVLSYQSKTCGGELQDAFRLIKQANGVSVLQESIDPSGSGNHPILARGL